MLGITWKSSGFVVSYWFECASILVLVAIDSTGFRINVRDQYECASLVINRKGLRKAVAKCALSLCLQVINEKGEEGSSVIILVNARR